MQLRWGIIGVGRAGQARARALHADPRATAQVGFRGDPASVNLRAAASVEDLLARVDAVAICSTDETHPALVRQALAAHKHVVCEFPLAPSAAEARALFALARAVDRVLHVEHIELLTGAAVWWREHRPKTVRSGTLAFTSPRTGVDPARGNVARLHRIVDILGEPESVAVTYWDQTTLAGALHFSQGTVAVDFRFGPGLPRETLIELVDQDGVVIRQQGRGITRNGQPVVLPTVGGLFAADQIAASARILDGAPGYVSEARVVSVIALTETLREGVSAG